MTEFTKEQIDEDLRIRAEDARNRVEVAALMRETVLLQKATMEIDWESRRWQVAVAAMQGLCAYPEAVEVTYDDLAERSIKFADALIAEYRKQETTNAR